MQDAICHQWIPLHDRQTRISYVMLFCDHPSFTPDMVSDLIFHDYLDGIPEAPKKGHDFDFFARKIKTVEQFLRYLPQLIREKHLNDKGSSSGSIIP